MDARWSTVSFLSFFLAALSAAPAVAVAPAAALGSHTALAPHAGIGQSARTQNFIIQAATPQLAQQVGQQAERYRSELAIQWLGRDLPPWSSPCTLKVIAGNIPAQGVTTYNRYPGHVGDFQMEVVGTPERIMDSVLPHEVTHAVLATHFGRPLPRWADEGVSTTVEHPSEKAKHDAKLREFLSTRRGLPMNRMFLLKEYPSDMLPLYAQGYSVARFLIEQNGHRGFIEFIEDYMEQGSWTAVVEQHYGYESLAELQEYWLSWVADGSGPVDQYVKRSDAAPAPGQVAAGQVAATPARAQPGTLAAASGNVPPSMMRAAAVQTPAGSAATTTPGAIASVASLSSQPGEGGQPSEGGWYLRRRQEASVGGKVASLETPAAADRGRDTTTPYSVSQPQPEQGAVHSAPAGPAARWSPSQSTKWR